MRKSLFLRSTLVFALLLILPLGLLSFATVSQPVQAQGPCQLEYGGPITGTAVTTSFDDVVQPAPPPTTTDDIIVGVHQRVEIDPHTCAITESAWSNITLGELENYDPHIDKTALAAEIDWDYYGFGSNTNASHPGVWTSQASGVNQESVEKWSTRASWLMYEVVGKYTAWAASEYRFKRDVSVGNVTWAGPIRNHGAGLFPAMPHWTKLNQNWAKSCDWGGPCIPNSNYWETSYGLFKATFPLPGITWDVRIWALSEAMGPIVAIKPCAVGGKSTVNGPFGGTSDTLPAAGIDKNLVCVKVNEAAQ